MIKVKKIYLHSSMVRLESVALSNSANANSSFTFQYG